MTSLSRKNSLCKASLLALTLLCSSGVGAATLNGSLTGNTLTWLNGMSQGSNITLSNWQLVSNLQPTTEWVPGTFMGTPPATLTLLGNTGQSVEIPMQIVGLQYNLGQASGRFSISAIAPPGYNTCGTSDQGGGIATVIGERCLAAKSYQASSAYTPFQFARPVIALDDAALVSAFQAARVGSGQYTGTVMVSPAYGFRSPTGNWTYRKAMAVPVTLSLRYEAAMLSDITVSGSGVIPAQYDTRNHTVSGSTRYDVTAEGYFTDGLKLTFEDNMDGEYALNPQSGSGKAIPYDIDCGLCSDSNVVTNGVLNLSRGETQVLGTGSTLRFSFDISYNISAADIESGNYDDVFIVYFEENL